MWRTAMTDRMPISCPLIARDVARRRRHRSVNVAHDGATDVSLSPSMPRSSLARAVPPTAPPAPPPRPAPPRITPSASGNRRLPPRRAQAPWWPVVVAATVLTGISLVGLPYYAAVDAARVRHAWHPWLRPSGYIGQTAGIVAFFIFVFLWLYPLRKRLRSLAWTGAVGRWLDVHVATAVTMPLLLAIHAGWRADGLIGLGFDAILVVCASGVAGRYLYTRIPRARSGVELTREEVTRQREELIANIAATTGLPVVDVERSLRITGDPSARRSAWAAVASLIRADVQRWTIARELPRRWAALAPRGTPVSRHAVREAVRLARREIALTQQSQVLEATHRVFRFWHVAHRPFAITALIAVVVHVVVVVAVGSTWFH